ncbi:hypothetical protein tinsulaeT_34990 [Thalassotalea insulae]|uniref:Sulfotransferase domain-containing protein n=1 Tax=Thalassotalea insulae TaxID=2056778 RepID=A0ABQ6GWW5_9GAMM|nr:hypothetical protein [Thalassotalea insulae]GLX80159.1 hypothetical protein tinsulaeT_34990 [Thalassotalea insulae]
MHQLTELLDDDFKIIYCVRNPAWGMDSVERIYRKNPFDYSRMFTPQTRQTVYSRCESMMSTVGVCAWIALKEAYYGEHSARLLLVDNDLLVSRPARCMELLYQFIDQSPFPHDFDHVEYEAGEFDTLLGVKGQHKVKQKVEFTPRRTILPPELFAKYSDMAFWQDSNGTSASTIVAKSSSS